ncbi:hypothetical protein OIE66_09695 [Nonomuraea sp. NBC_01738]|uniref:hypothetical protein n=1 Tax=Nonomuraea sp. NBC_01738 TaxID=2976003 RepID=UPI002E0E44F3|nr:hypothetical protein OIE66_09695 [Nonomuraea sp. NBC_01738]
MPAVPQEQPRRKAPSAADMADQRTVTFAAPTADVMSILGAGAQPVPPPVRPEPPRPEPVTTSGSFSAVSTGSFPAVPPGPINGAPTSDPFPAYNGGGSGSWAAQPQQPQRDVLDDPSPQSPTPSGSWPAFEGAYSVAPRGAGDFPTSYEVRAGWAVADDSDALTTGPSPAAGTPTAPARAVSAYDDVLSAPPAPTFASYETGDYAAPADGGAPAAWPEPPVNGTSSGSWPSYGEMYPAAETPAAPQGGRRRRAPEQDPDYYR